jgi:hypothetical protein
MDYVKQSFASVYDWHCHMDARRAITAVRFKERKRSYRASEKDESPDWSPLTLQDAQTIAAGGGYDHKTAADIKAITPTGDRARPAPAAPDMTLARAGIVPVVPAFLTGHPLNMLMISDTATAPARVLRVAVNISCAARVSAKAMALRGAAILAQIDALEKTNIRVELDAIYATGTDDACQLLTINIKRAASPYNPAAVAFGIANLATSRRLCFEHVEQMAMDDNEQIATVGTDIIGDCYGYTAETAEDDIAERYDVVFSRGTPKNCNFRTFSAAAEYVRATFSTAGAV